MENLTREFIAETLEKLQFLEEGFVRLEHGGDHAPLIDALFRLIHTVKGNASFLNLPRLGRLAHGVEDFVTRYRDEGLRPDPSSVTLLLSCLDRLRNVAEGLLQEGHEPSGGDEELLLRLAEGEPVQDLPRGKVLQPIASVQGVRVRADVLADLMTTAEELVLARNRFLQVQDARKAQDYAQPAQLVSRGVTALQETVMRARLQPLAECWAGLPRIARDAALAEGKDVDFSAQGGDTEADRQILEALRDPLTHLVRNAIAHGIEPPQERLAAGKPARGSVTVCARVHGGGIVVEVKDDGGGIDDAAVAEVALQKGLLQANALKTMDAGQIRALVFQPGFSTVRGVTALAGRGVGLDVVKSNIDGIGGRIALRSEQGRGTVFTINIPLSVAVMQTLIVDAGGHCYALPQDVVREVVPLSGSRAVKSEEAGGLRIVRLRGQILGLVDLRALLKLELVESAPQVAVILVAEGRIFAMAVDNVTGLQEIVVKPLPPILRQSALFSGSAVLGDGRVALIIEAGMIAATSGTEDQERA